MMRFEKGKRLLLLVLAFLVLLSAMPAYTFANSISYTDDYASHKEGTAIFNPDSTSNAYISSVPKDSLYEADTTIDPTQFADLVMVIDDYYKGVSGLWYKVKAAEGHTLPEALVDYPWIYQNDWDSDTYPDALIVTPPAEIPSVSITDAAGNAIESVTMGIYEKPVITANTPQTAEAVKYQWQIAYGDDMWVDIYGSTEKTLKLSYGLVYKLLDGGKVYVRCVTTVDSVVIVTDPVAVTLTEERDTSSAPAETDSVIDAKQAEETEKTENPGFKLTAAGNAGEDDTDTTLYNVVINYVFENGDIAAAPYSARIGASATLTETVTFPTVQGYQPHVNEERQDAYTFNLKGSEMTEDFSMTVVYKPALVDYTVIVMRQNDYNDNYTEYARETLQALTGTVISSDDQVDLNYPGFYQLLHSDVKIAADGSTVIEVRYDRYYYLMTFDLGDGGYGVLPVYARYGTKVEIEDPKRPGYEFSKWIDHEGEEVEFPQLMPARNTEYQAQWIAKNAKYSVVYWKENADPNADGTYGYTYWGSRIVETEAGSIVSGKDDIPTSITNATVDGKPVDEKKYFTYNDTLTDKKVQVKGDGSTVVNVYYTRNDYTIYFKGYGTCCLEAHTHGTGCNSKLVCALQEHSHENAGCTRTLSCQIAEHDKHTDSCLKCGKDEHTEHTNACLRCTHECSWYCIFGCLHRKHDASCYTDEIHIHDNSCYKDEIHQHAESCYVYSCGLVNHSHGSGCYSACTIPEHKESNTCNSNSTDNIIYVITAKYEADIADLWPTYDKLAAADSNHHKNTDGVPVGENGKTFRGWDVDNASAEAVSKRINMTPDLCDTENGYQTAEAKYGASYSYRLYYMFESFDQTETAESDTRKKYNGKWYDSDPAYYQELMYNDNDTTFNQKEVLGMNPAGREKKSSGSGDNLIVSNWLYYTRNVSNLYYQNIDTVVATKTNIKFGESLANYQYTANNGIPSYPSSLEAGAYEFAGWYTTADCYEGTKVNYNTDTMPNGDVTLYAKWEPVTLTVKFYSMKDPTTGEYREQIGETYEVKHGQKLNEQYIPEAPEDFENGAYTFDGWYYMAGKDERRFDFAMLPVTENLVVYAKWTSNTQISYEIHFELADGTPVADPIIGSDMAGTTKTFDAKGATDLYAAYQQGYYPNAKSHSLTLSIEETGENAFTFIYAPHDPVPYTVYYAAKALKEGGTALGTITVDGETYHLIAKTKSVTDNHLAYVSENFVPVSGYMPDKYQKNLVIVPGAENVIVFDYSVDNENALAKITHYVQNVDEETWTVWYSDQRSGEIGSTISENPLSLNGFTYDASASKPSGVITAEGLELELYYTRNSYPYQVVYKLQSTGDVLYTSEVIKEIYGKVVAATAPNKFDDYSLVSEATQTVTIRMEDDENTPTVNVITFYYDEAIATIDYVVVGPQGSGDVSVKTETVKASFGVANGSKAVASDSAYRFVGWYDNRACTGDPISTDASFVPAKPGELWVDATYYAKFEYNLTSLTLVVDGADAYADIDPNQTFVFHIKGENVDLDVTVHGSDWTAVIDGLTVGARYTITEKTDWSWRYSCTGWTYSVGGASGSGEGNEAVITLGLDGNITFTNTRKNNWWLDGDSWCNNIFK